MRTGYGLAEAVFHPQPFVFFGFLPRKSSDQETTLAPLQDSGNAGLFERKDRLQETLEHAFALLGTSRGGAWPEN
jgi:16S rRNA C1402 (ribose-2'-O) methylase RsmI